MHKLCTLHPIWFICHTHMSYSYIIFMYHVSLISPISVKHTTIKHKCAPDGALLPITQSRSSSLLSFLYLGNIVQFISVGIRTSAREVYESGSRLIPSHGRRIATYQCNCTTHRCGPSSIPARSYLRNTQVTVGDRADGAFLWQLGTGWHIIESSRNGCY